MDKCGNLICLIIILTLHLSCVGNKSSEKETHTFESGRTLNTDTLKFTSGIRAIFQDSKGNYWLGSQNEGISYYDGKSFEYFTIADGLSDNQIRSIQEDNDGNIWFGTANGANVYDGKTITSYSKTKEDPIVEWNKTSGNLWFNAGEKNGVYRFDGKSMNFLSFAKFTNEDPNNSYGVTDISNGVDGKVWIATYNALFYFNGGLLEVFDHSKLSLEKNENLHVRSVLVDSKGRVWIGNNGIGVLLMEKGKTVNFSRSKGLIAKNSARNGSTSLAGTLEHVFVIEEDAEGNIWFGDRDTGAWQFDGKNMINHSIEESTSNSMIWSIYKDNKNNLLFGLANGKVFRFNGKSFERFF